MSPISPESLRSFYAPTYDELKKLNMGFKAKYGTAAAKTDVLAFLKKESRIKAVTVAFADLEGRLHMLDYDKDFFLDGYTNLTFDGSSIRGFTAQSESDLRLSPDFGSFRILPADIFGAGKVFLFATILDKDGTPYASDFRGLLMQKAVELKKQGMTYLVAPEIEGFLLEGMDAEQQFDENKGFSLVTRGGYFAALPQDTLRKFIDTVAEAQRALGFENEKDHPEVAPSQFEINFKYAEVVQTADQILLYKLVCRQVAKLMGHTASFLPKPVVGINGSGMHSNMSMAKNGKNIFFDAKGQDGLSEYAWQFAAGILGAGRELALTICPSVNAYRRLDPHFEAPNEIKITSCDRGSMVRVPLANEKSARIEVRSVAPDANPYLAYFVLLSLGLAGTEAKKKVVQKAKADLLPGCIGEAIAAFEKSSVMKEILGAENHAKYAELKKASADRAPAALGTRVKRAEVAFHHEVYNQVLWNEF